MSSGAYFLSPLKPTSKGCPLGISTERLISESTLPFWKASFLAFQTVAPTALEQRHFVFQELAKNFWEAEFILSFAHTRGWEKGEYKYVGTSYFDCSPWKILRSHWLQGLLKQPGVAAAMNGLFLSWCLRNPLFSSVQIKIVTQSVPSGNYHAG